MDDDICQGCGQLICECLENKRILTDEKNLKLFIWTDFCPNYTGGLAFAIAENETQARKLIEKYRGFEVYHWGELQVKPLTKRVARCVSGGG